MDMTERAVGRFLGLGRAATARVLAAGLAGEPFAAGGARLYDRAAVEALARRRRVDERTPLPRACDRGVLVARVNPAGGRESVLARACGPYRLGVGRATVLAVLLGQQGRVPLVATVGGYVVAGADVVARSTDDAALPRTTLQTRPPGDWWDSFAGRRLPTGPGDPLLFWRCRLCPPVPRDRPRRRAGGVRP
jgi:hypothetical protein